MAQESGWWDRVTRYWIEDQKSGFQLDVSRMKFDEVFLARQEQSIRSALTEIAELERGVIANADEQRMVGHYWLRDPERAPQADITRAITGTIAEIKRFASEIHSASIRGSSGKQFRGLLLVGIGGSALGPQFVTQALGCSNDKLRLSCFDNTDPEGMARVLAAMPYLDELLVVVVSKSGGTKETRNGQLVAAEALRRAGLNPAKHFVAVTCEGSELDKIATSEGWLARFPMWDWVGGRTSELSAVGLLPAALQGYDIDAMLSGARHMDQLTRGAEWRKNPAAMLALMWFYAGSGRGQKDMVVLPYRDRLELLSKYLQQLVMESLGKELDRAGVVVNQGLAVYGNKGSTDQHAYVQQLREGVLNFFAVFIEVLEDTTRDEWAAKFAVEPGITSGDYLSGFLLGTRRALYEKGRESITITIRRVDAFNVGMLIALFERAVGLYASLVNVNAYHQPGVEAGKKAAAEVLRVQSKVLEVLQNEGRPQAVEQIAAKLAVDCEVVFKILHRLVANARVRAIDAAHGASWQRTFKLL